MTNIFARSLLLVCSVLLLSKCTALQTIENASKALDVYELRPITFDPPRQARGTRSLLVELPTASGTFATDRIVVKPSELEVKYLPGARWTDDAPAHLQRLLAVSLTNSGRFGHVSLSDADITPGFVLLSNLDTLHATTPVGDSKEVEVSVRATLTLIKDEDHTLLGSRTFAAKSAAASDAPANLIPAFDQAMQSVLREALDWVIATTR